ncbi:uncharacterized protein LOC143446869 [Clavelina lepadiformis]|uniref:uncharacterized protein LOC143445850 n=1 Tax=Clavelina lepadiformis TaxID=159417 RepID=UPI0040434724
MFVLLIFVLGAVTIIMQKFKCNPNFNKRIKIKKADITALKVDAITNAANESLLGGGGVDGAIHRAAGHELLRECRTLNGCKTGEAKITKGYKLPARHVIHTVGPIGEQPEKLQSCYYNSLELARRNNLSSIAFPCISTGVYGYPNEHAARVALGTVRQWMEENGTNLNLKIIFCLFLEIDKYHYGQLVDVYFPGFSAKSVKSKPELDSHAGSDKIQDNNVQESNSSRERPSQDGVDAINRAGAVSSSPAGGNEKTKEAVTDLDDDKKEKKNSEKVVTEQQEEVDTLTEDKSKTKEEQKDVEALGSKDLKEYETKDEDKRPSKAAKEHGSKDAEKHPVKEKRKSQDVDQSRMEGADETEPDDKPTDSESCAHSENGTSFKKQEKGVDVDTYKQIPSEFV